MPLAQFEPRASGFEWAKIVHASDRMGTVDPEMMALKWEIFSVNASNYVGCILFQTNTFPAEVRVCILHECRPPLLIVCGGLLTRCCLYGKLRMSCTYTKQGRLEPKKEPRIFF
jgi:hypothetical protein